MTDRILFRNFFFLCLLVLMLAGCREDRKAGNQAAVAERQECFLKHYTHLTGEVFPLTVKMDIPAEESRTVMDSVTAFLNETLYRFFDDGEDRHLPYDQVFSTNLDRLAERYRDAYAPFFLADSSDMHEFLSDCLEINLAASTKSFLTYEIRHLFFGEGLEVDTEWVTFVRNDGHRLAEVISGADLLRFYKDFPQFRNEDVWSYLVAAYPDDLHSVDGAVGLLPDSVVHQFTYAPGIFEEDIHYPLKEIAPYLSREAQELIR